MSPEEPLHIRYVVTGVQLYVAFNAGATHRVSLAAERITREFLADDPEQPVVVLDLDGCAWVDSTFAGWMINLRQRVAQADGRLIVSRCPQACLDSLDVMGLTALFEFETMTPPGEMKHVVCPDEATDADTIEFMLDAHQRLIDVNPANKRAFTPLAAKLRSELKKRKR